MWRYVGRCMVHLACLAGAAAVAGSLALALAGGPPRTVHAFVTVLVLVPVVAGLLLILLLTVFGVTQPLLGAALFLFGRAGSVRGLAGVVASVMLLAVCSVAWVDWLGGSCSSLSRWTAAPSPAGYAICLGIQTGLAGFSGWRLRRRPPQRGTLPRTVVR